MELKNHPLTVDFKKLAGDQFDVTVVRLRILSTLHPVLKIAVKEG